MDSGRPPAENRGESHVKGGHGLEPLSDHGPRGTGDSLELACIEKLLKADWGGRRGEPMTTEELLMIGGAALEPLFHEPPVGPVPEHLAPHLSVHGCVAEYEEKFEELDRWKALELSRWLKDRVGGSWRVAAKVYELGAQKDETGASEKFLFKLIENRTVCGKPAGDES